MLTEFAQSKFNSRSSTVPRTIISFSLVTVKACGGQADREEHL